MKEQNLFISNFKKFGLLLVCSAGILMLFVILLNTIVENQIIFKSEISGAAKINRILNENHKEEIPILGSSRANGSFVPSIINENCYNYGINGTHSNVWIFFLRQELKKDKTTPIIINMDLEGLQSSLGDINNYIPHSANKGIKKLVAENKQNLPSGVFKYFGTFESYYKFFLNERISFTKKVDQGGTFEIERLSKEKFDKLVNQRLKAETAFLVNNLAFKELDSLIQATDRIVILAVAPYHKSYFNNFVNYESAERYLDVLNKSTNCHVLNYGRMVLNDSMFSNTSHLNYSGALAFSKKLKSDLDELGIQ